MIIGITGKSSSGKSTVASILVKNHGFVEIAFADSLKKTAQQIWNFTDEQLWGPSSKRNEPDRRYPREHSSINNLSWNCTCCGLDLATIPEDVGLNDCFLTPRYALQLLGTEYGRHCYKNVWVDRTFDAIKRFAAVDFVISDVRFPNEVKAIHEAGGFVWKTTRGAGLDGGGAAHESESHIDKLAVHATMGDNPLEEMPGIVASYLEIWRGELTKHKGAL